MQSGVSSDTIPADKPSADRAIALSNVGLDVSTDSETGDNTPAKREKFRREKRTPRHTSRAAAQLPKRQSSPQRTQASRSRRSRINKVKRPRSCDRCANRTQGRHHATCLKVGQFHTYVICPRCQCSSTIASQWRYHAHTCYKQWPRDHVLPTTDWDELVRSSDVPITQHSCLQCKWWRSPHSTLTDIHYVLCSAFPDVTPALPPNESIVNHNQDIYLPLDVAQLLELAFQRKTELKVSLTFGYLYKHAIVRLLQEPNADGTPGRQVTADLPLPHLLHMRAPAVPDSVADTEPDRRPTPGNNRSCPPPSKRPHPKSSIEALSSPERSVEPVKRSRASRPGTPPTSNVITGIDSLTLRDRFKVQKPNGSWCDAYGRSTSPISTIKRAAPKPAITMRGFLTSKSSFLLPHEFTVSGHLPTGWGRFCLPEGAPSNGAYKSTPGDPTRLPAITTQMCYSVNLYFADDLRVPAGTLYTDVPLHEHQRLEYRAAGVSSCINVRPYTTALPSEGGETAK